MKINILIINDEYLIMLLIFSFSLFKAFLTDISANLKHRIKREYAI